MIPVVKLIKSFSCIFVLSWFLCLKFHESFLLPFVLSWFFCLKKRFKPSRKWRRRDWLYLCPPTNSSLLKLATQPEKTPCLCCLVDPVASIVCPQLCSPALHSSRWSQERRQAKERWCTFLLVEVYDLLYETLALRILIVLKSEKKRILETTLTGK